MQNMSKKKATTKTGAEICIVEVNKKARREYEILDTFEAGIALTGAEVKSVRAGGASLRESYVRVRNGECWLAACRISPYSFSRADEHDPARDKKLLLHKAEISKIAQNVQAKGLSLIPLKLYFNQHGRCKVEIALCRGKKLYDKRDDIKKRAADRQISRVLKGQRG